MRLVILESPYSGDTDRNIDYTRRCVADSIKRHEAPLASHLLYTQPGILDDNDAAERALGIAAGHAWYHVAQHCVVYEDHGISLGMEDGIARAKYFNVPIEYRKLG